MKLFYSVKKGFAFLLMIIPLFVTAQQMTTVVPSVNCNFAYTFNTTDEGFSAPSIYSDPNDFGLYWNGSQLQEVTGSFLTNRTASTISGIYLNTEMNRTTIGFDYTVPAGTEYRIRVVSGVTNPPLEILATTANGPLWTAFAGTSGSLCLELQDMDLPAGAHLRYEIGVRTVNPGNIVFDNFRKQAFTIPLPVTFLGFIARETPGGLKLLWNVAEEINVRGYEIESSTDGANFTSIGFVAAGGKDNYSFLHAEFSGTRYFRIKNVDIDNNYKYSGTIRVVNDQPITDLRLYPVPAGEMVYLEHQKQSQAGIISVISSEGRVLRQINTIPNSYQTSINLGGLNSGIYFIKLEYANGLVRTLSCVKN
jgi:Secretion system C-terminal sorting domain